MSTTAVTLPISIEETHCDLSSSVPSPDTKIKDAHVIAISSGKGGVGKTNITVNLGIALASQGKKVCIFDADTSLANINILLGLSPIFTLEHLLAGEKSIDEIILEGPAGLSIVPAASGVVEFIDLGQDPQQRLLTALQTLESQFDYLLIDTAAGISESLLSFLKAAPLTILIITPEPTSLTDAFSLIKVLKHRKITHPIFVLTNMVPSRQTAHNVYKRFRGAVAKYLDIKVHYIGHILSDSKLVQAVLQQKAVLSCCPDSQASRCISGIATRLEELIDSKGELSKFSDTWAQLLPPTTEEPETTINTEDIKSYFLTKGATAEAETLLLELLQIRETRPSTMNGESTNLTAATNQPTTRDGGSVDFAGATNQPTTRDGGSTQSTRSARGAGSVGFAGATNRPPPIPTPTEKPNNPDETEITGLLQAIQYAQQLDTF